RSRGARIVDLIIAALAFVAVLICLLPMLHVLARSLSSSEALIRGQVTFWPVGFNIQAYKVVLSDSKYPLSLVWTLILTSIYAPAAMTVTGLAASTLTYEKLQVRRLINLMILFTMYSNAGMIPVYLLLKDLGLLTKPAVLVIPTVLSVFNMIIMRSFFYTIPTSLRESAEIDGASPVMILTRIYLPLSKPVLATLSLFYAVGRWNGYSDALMFMNDRRYHPIQLLLYNILKSITSIDVATLEGFRMPGLNETIQAATVMFATVPILLVYPWLQKYFIHGATLGAI